MPSVYVLLISHRSGNDVTVHYTIEGATRFLAQWCREWWQKEVHPSEPPPEDDDELIALYFDQVLGESHEIHLAAVMGDEPTPAKE